MRSSYLQVFVFEFLDPSLEGSNSLLSFTNVHFTKPLSILVILKTTKKNNIHYSQILQNFANLIGEKYDNSFFKVAFLWLLQVLDCEKKYWSYICVCLYACQCVRVCIWLACLFLLSSIFYKMFTCRVL